MGKAILFICNDCFLRHNSLFSVIAIGTFYSLCPFAEYYLRYEVTSFFTISRISLADGKRAGQKVQRKIAGAVQNVKPLSFKLFVPLF
jgi:hypothetical protein